MCVRGGRDVQIRVGSYLCTVTQKTFSWQCLHSLWVLIFFLSLNYCLFKGKDNLLPKCWLWHKKTHVEIEVPFLDVVTFHVGNVVYDFIFVTFSCFN